LRDILAGDVDHARLSARVEMGELLQGPD
jgi:hypothetical protein